MESIRDDWTPLEKRYFEDIALGFLEVNTASWPDAQDAFTNWLHHKDSVLLRYADAIWPYVVTNWSDGA